MGEDQRKKKKETEAKISSENGIERKKVWKTNSTQRPTSKKQAETDKVKKITENT